MTLDEVLGSLFAGGYEVTNENGLVLGTGALNGHGRADVIGVAQRTPLGAEEAIRLSAHVIRAVERDEQQPIIVLIDSDSQRMSKRDELLGLSEFLAHLAKCLMYADLRGHHTVGILYGHSAAGAFIATALATRTLVALPGAAPEVMDLASMAKITQLPLDVLVDKARTTPVFAPGLDNLAQTGAVLATWDETISLAAQLETVLRAAPDRTDERDRVGRARGGRLKAAAIAARVYELARQPD